MNIVLCRHQGGVQPPKDLARLATTPTQASAAAPEILRDLRSLRMTIFLSIYGRWSTERNESIRSPTHSRSRGISTLVSPTLQTQGILTTALA